MRTPEGRNTAYLKRLCGALGVSAYKQHFDGVVGAPDWLLCHGGRNMMIELKAKSGVLSQQQKNMIESLSQNGGFNISVCSSPTEINRAIEEGLFGGVNVTGAL